MKDGIVVSAVRQFAMNNPEECLRQLDEMHLDHPERFRLSLAVYEKSQVVAIASALDPAARRHGNVILCSCKYHNINRGHAVQWD